MPRRFTYLFLCSLLVMAGLFPFLGPTSRAQADFTTNSSDNSRDGVVPGITAITPSSVQSPNFGLLYSTPVAGEVYAQPLIYQGVAYVATLDDDIYAINTSTGQVIWTQNYGTPVPNSCSDIDAPQGIVSTPVVDPSTNTLYFTSRTWNGSTQASIQWQLNALDLSSSTGAEKPGWPVDIAGFASNDPTDAFTPPSLLQRPGLLLDNGYLFLGFGSYCDTLPYQGWLASISVTSPVVHLWTAEANDPGSTTNSQASIWQSGTGLASDASGDIYFATGNGTPPPVGLGTVSSPSLGEAVVRLHLQADGTLNQVDHFAPQNAAYLNSSDYDLGSGAPALLPDNFAHIEGHPHLLALAGKLGNIYLLDRDNLGGVTAPGTPDRAIAEYQTPDTPNFDWVFGHPTDFTDGSTAALYFTGTYNPLRRYTVSNQGVIASAGASTVTFPFGSSSPTLSWNGTSPASAIIWAIRIQFQGVAPTLYAFSPTPNGSGVLPVLNSWTTPAWTLATKFNTPVVDGTRVYVGTNDGHLLAFGGLPSAPPALTATPSDGSVTITWQAPSNTGGPPILSYTATASGSSTPQTIPATSPLTATFNFANGTSHTYSVIAKNANGAGPAITTGQIITGPPPTVSSVSPNHGVTSGGTSLTVTGANFTSNGTSVTKLLLAGKTINATCPPSGSLGCFTIDSNTQLTVVTPSGPAGITDLRAISSQGESAATPQDQFTYYEPGQSPTVNSVTPSAGPTTGNQTVRVSGSAFAAGMTVTVGGVSVSPTSITSTSFSFVTPAESAGYTQIQVTTFQGSSPLTSSAGYIFSPLGSYVPLTPFRLLDTRSNDCVQCGGGALGPGGTRTLQITGVNGLPVGTDPIPADATALVLNVTAVDDSTASLLTIYPTGTSRPLASNLNFAAHRTIANLITVALGQTNSSDADREINIYNPLGTLNVVADVEGYFIPQANTNPAGEFHPIAPLRVCDTRTKQPANPCNLNGSSPVNLPVGPGGVIKVNLSAISGPGSDFIPSDGSAEAAVLNLTGIAGTSFTFLSAFPTDPNGNCTIPGGKSSPQFSNLNLPASIAQANRVMVALGPAAPGGPATDLCIYNALGSINLALDVNGWFGSSTATTAAQYQAIGPVRVCDTRASSGEPCAGTELTPGATHTISIAGVNGIPAESSSNPPLAIIGNLTAIAGTSYTYLALYPANLATHPNISDINPSQAEVLPNLVVVQLSPTGGVKLFNSLGSINAVLDIEGWFQ